MMLVEVFERNGSGVALWVGELPELPAVGDAFIIEGELRYVVRRSWALTAAHQPRISLHVERLSMYGDGRPLQDSRLKK